jgi:cell division protein FtsN
LRRSLSALGIETSVSYLPGRGGRHYYSVRSAPVAEQADASAALAKAGEALHIAPLLHHERSETDENAVQAADASPRPETSAGAEHGRYWVQFGVFAVQRFAERFKARLQNGGIATTTSPRLRRDGRTLYYVRSSLLPDRQSAAALAERAHTLLGTAVLIGLSETRDKG